MSLAPPWVCSGYVKPQDPPIGRSSPATGHFRITVDDVVRRVADLSGVPRRKLISEWVEANLQRTISRQPEKYQACTQIVLSFAPPPPPVEGQAAARVEVGVDFV
jgi:hypothetical protein